MPKVAIIGGSGFKAEKFLKGFEQTIVKTMYGNVLLFVKDKVIFLPRHGKNKTIPPHKVNHRANICALNLQGVEKIVSINSVGSLKEAIKPGSVLIPDDYVDFSPESFFEFELRSIVPGFDKKLRKDLIAAAKKAKVVTKNKGVYVQTQGPRFETKAEIKIIKKWGEVVGMTMGSEATLANELSLPYAAMCLVDNYAHGITKKSLSMDALEKMHNKNLPKIEKVLKEFMKKSK